MLVSILTFIILSVIIGYVVLIKVTPQKNPFQKIHKKIVDFRDLTKAETEKNSDVFKGSYLYNNTVNEKIPVNYELLRKLESFEESKHMVRKLSKDFSEFEESLEEEKGNTPIDSEKKKETSPESVQIVIDDPLQHSLDELDQDANGTVDGDDYDPQVHGPRFR